jgi:PAS domain S-box-containing protein
MPQAAFDALGDDAGLAKLITMNAADAIFLMDGEGRTLFANPAAEKMFGWTKEELVGRVLHDILHHHRPDGRPFPISECPLGDVFVTGRSLEAHEDIFFDRHGRQVPVSCSNAAILREGRVSGGVLVVRDITERQVLEQQRELLRGELAHRIKNLISIIQAIAKQTLRGEDLPAARDVFLSRLGAIAQAQSLLSDDQDAAAGLEDVLNYALRPFQSGAQSVAVGGPPVMLSPKQVLTLSMAVHELATNSLKYGAFSVPDGRVTVNWDSLEAEDGRRLMLAWSESGGPPVEPPTKKGFGTRIIEQVLAADFSGNVQIVYAPEGLICRLEGLLSQ